MNLKKSYNDTKNKGNNMFLINATAFTCAIGVFAAAFYILNLLWNHAASAWGLPIIGYTQFAATLVILKFLLVFLFGINIPIQSQRDYDPTASITHMLKEHPDEEQ